MKQQIVIIANGAPYGSESLFNALRLGIALNEQEGIDLKLFLMSDAVSAALAGQSPAEGYNLRQLLETLLAQAGTAVAPVALHTATAKRFAADMAALGQAITEAQAEGDATLTAALRTMVTTVTVHRNYELEITGNLAPLTRGEEMVAGDRLERNPQTPPDSIPFIIKAAA